MRRRRLWLEEKRFTDIYGEKEDFILIDCFCDGFDVSYMNKNGGKRHSEGPAHVDWIFVEWVCGIRKECVVLFVLNK